MRTADTPVNPPGGDCIPVHCAQAISGEDLSDAKYAQRGTRSGVAVNGTVTGGNLLPLWGFFTPRASPHSGWQADRRDVCSNKTALEIWDERRRRWTRRTMTFGNQAVLIGSSPHVFTSPESWHRFSFWPLGPRTQGTSLKKPHVAVMLKWAKKKRLREDWLFCKAFRDSRYNLYRSGSAHVH